MVKIVLWSGKTPTFKLVLCENACVGMWITWCLPTCEYSNIILTLCSALTHVKPLAVLLQRLVRESDAVQGRSARWGWEGLSVCALQTALTLVGSMLCVAAMGRHIKMSVFCWWPAAWGTQTWRSCTMASAKVSVTKFPCKAVLHWSKKNDFFFS